MGANWQSSLQRGTQQSAACSSGSKGDETTCRACSQADRALAMERSWPDNAELGGEGANGGSWFTIAVGAAVAMGSMLGWRVVRSCRVAGSRLCAPVCVLVRRRWGRADCTEECV